MTLTKQLPGAKLKGEIGEILNMSDQSNLNTVHTFKYNVDISCEIVIVSQKKRIGLILNPVSKLHLSSTNSLFSANLLT